MEADFRHILKCCFFQNWPTQSWVNWRNFLNSPFSIIEIIEKKEKWQFFGSEWQISIIVEDQIRLWRLYFCAWINRRGDTAIRYFRVWLVDNIRTTFPRSVYDVDVSCSVCISELDGSTQSLANDVQGKFPNSNCDDHYQQHELISL